MRVFGTICVVSVLSAVPAAAQTGAPGGTARAGGLYIGGLAGMQAVENIAAQAGVELGWHLSDKIDVVGEGTWLQDTVTRRRTQVAASVATYLQQAQGKTATATITAPAWFIGGGARVFLTAPRSFRPYFLAEAGVARVVLKPAFVLGGSDITTSLPTYGVTLGADLTGEATKPAITGGFGVVALRGAWQVDAGVRLTSIQTDSQTTNVARVQFGVARRF